MAENETQTAAVGAVEFVVSVRGFQRPGPLSLSPGHRELTGGAASRLSQANTARAPRSLSEYRRAMADSG